MKLTKTNEWCISTDGEYFFDDGYNSKEEAIESIKDNYRYDGGYIGRLVNIEFVENDISYTNITDVLNDVLADEIGEASESWEFTAEQNKEISQIAAKAVIDYINKNNLQPRCYKVIDIEFIEVGEQE